MTTQKRPPKGQKMRKGWLPKDQRHRIAKLYLRRQKEGKQ